MRVCTCKNRQKNVIELLFITGIPKRKNIVRSTMQARGSFMILLIIFSFVIISFSNKYIPKTKTGFSATDNSIQLPYMEIEKVSAKDCALIWLLISSMIIISIELYHYRGIKNKAMYAFYTILNFTAGAVVTYTITTLLKQIVRELRPNFIDLCGINYELAKEHYISNIDMHIHISNYTCINTKSLTNYDAKLEDAYMSFISGHASFSAYAANFLCIYLAYFIPNYISIRKTVIISLLIFILKTFTQITLFTLALCIAFSRLADHRHHLMNILLGLALGCIIAKYSFGFYITTGIRRMRYF